MADPAREKWWDRVVTDDSIRLEDGTHLLWGDRVRVLAEDQSGVLVSARGTQGRVRADQLGDGPVLEIYVIDVGQGDGILVVTPEGHHLMIDGGNPRPRQPTRRNAADFVDWKFHEDYRTDDTDPNEINLDVLIASHADRDHFGGLQDVIAVRDVDDGLDTDATTVGRFVHPGLSPRVSGTDDLGQRLNGHFINLLEGRQSAIDAVAGTVDQPRLASSVAGGSSKSCCPRSTMMGNSPRSSGSPIAAAPWPGSMDRPARGPRCRSRLWAPSRQTSAANRALRTSGTSARTRTATRWRCGLTTETAVCCWRGISTSVLNVSSSIISTSSLQESRRRPGPNGGSTWPRPCHHGSHHVRFDFLPTHRSPRDRGLLRRRQQLRPPPPVGACRISSGGASDPRWEAPQGAADLLHRDRPAQSTSRPSPASTSTTRSRPGVGRKGP